MGMPAASNNGGGGGGGGWWWPCEVRRGPAGGDERGRGERLPPWRGRWRGGERGDGERWLRRRRECEEEREREWLREDLDRRRLRTLRDRLRSDGDESRLRLRPRDWPSCRFLVIRWAKARDHP
jgi:hypothetical protein